MKRVAIGVAAGAAVAAAYLATATASADTGDTPAPADPAWTPTYGDSTMLQDTGMLSEIWKQSAIFTNTDGTTLSGTDYVGQNWWGGYDNQFVTDTGDVYNQNQLLPGFTNLYYNPAGDDTAAVDILKTPFGNINLSAMADSFAPADLSAVAAASPDEILGNAGLYSTLNLGLPTDAPAGSWSPVYDTAAAEQLVDPTSGSLAWSVPSDFAYTTDDGDLVAALTGDSYLTQNWWGGVDDQFVGDDGAIYDQSQLLPGLTNLYYDPAGDDGAIVDMLKTPFGTFDISWAASWFTPTDMSDWAEASSLDALTNSGLFSALDLGLTPDVADPTAFLGLDLGDLFPWL